MKCRNAAFLLFAIAFPGACHASLIYYLDGEGVSRANVDGSQRQRISSAGHGFGHIAADANANKLFWSGDGALHFSDLDGDNPGTIDGGGPFVLGVAVDAERQAVYWSETALNKIWRADYDGQNREAVIEGENTPWGLIVDSANDRLCWASSGGDAIRCSDLDGQAAYDLLANRDWPRDVALDGNGRIYWTEAGTNAGLYRANADGTDVQLIQIRSNGVPVLARPDSLAVDAAAEDLWWVDTLYPLPGASIRKSDLDGNQVVTVLPPGTATAIEVVVPEPAALLLIVLGTIGIACRRAIISR